MRFLVAFIGGLVIGALIAFTTANVLQQRNPWPRSLMNLMQHEVGAARDVLHANRCDDPATAAAAAHLDFLSRDIQAAVLGPDAHDRVFAQYVDDFRKSVATFGAAKGCSAQRAALTDLANACEACHRDYK